MPKRIPTHRPKWLPQTREAGKREAAAQQRARPEGKWYNSTRWKELRKLILSRDPYCVRCAGEGRVTPSDTVNHRTPHKSDYDRFWDVENLEGVCKSCHSGPIQSEERAAQKRRPEDC